MHRHTHSSPFLYAPIGNPCTRTLGLENEQFQTVNPYLKTPGAHKNDDTGEITLGLDYWKQQVHQNATPVGSAYLFHLLLTVNCLCLSMRVQ